MKSSKIKSKRDVSPRPETPVNDETQRAFLDLGMTDRGETLSNLLSIGIPPTPPISSKNASKSSAPISLTVRDEAFNEAFLSAIKAFESLPERAKEQIAEKNGQLETYWLLKDAPSSVTDRLTPEKMPANLKEDCIKICTTDKTTPYKEHFSASGEIGNYACNSCTNNFALSEDVGIWRCGTNTEHSNCSEAYCSKCYLKNFVVEGYLSWVQQAKRLTQVEKQEVAEKTAARKTKMEESKKKRLMTFYDSVQILIEKKVQAANSKEQLEKLQGKHYSFFTDVPSQVYKKFSKPSFEDYEKFMPRCDADHQIWRPLKEESDQEYCSECYTYKDYTKMYKCADLDCVEQKCHDCLYSKLVMESYFQNLEERISEGMSAEQHELTKKAQTQRLKTQRLQQKALTERELRELWPLLSSFEYNMDEEHRKSLKKQGNGILLDLLGVGSKMDASQIEGQSGRRKSQRFTAITLEEFIKSAEPDERTLEKIIAKCSCGDQVFKKNQHPTQYDQSWTICCDGCTKEITVLAGFRRCLKDCNFDLCESCYCTRGLTSWYKELIEQVELKLNDQDRAQIEKNRKVREKKEYKEVNEKKEQNVLEQWDDIQNYIKNEMNKQTVLRYSHDKRFKNVYEFQNAGYVQAIINPVNQNEIITVQKFHQSLSEANPPSNEFDNTESPDDEDNPKDAVIKDAFTLGNYDEEPAEKSAEQSRSEYETKKSSMPTCTQSNCHGIYLKKAQFDFSDKVEEGSYYCSSCQEKIDEDEGFRKCEVGDHESPYLCNDCFEKNAVNKHFDSDYTKQKSHTVRRYNLQPAHETLEEIFEDEGWKKFSDQRKLEAIEDKSREGNPFVSSYEYATLKYTQNKNSQRNEKGYFKPAESESGTQFIFGFWALEGKGESSFYKCYRSFIFKSALCVSNISENWEVQKVLHKGDNNEVYFFYETNEEGQEREVDIEEAKKYKHIKSRVFAQIELASAKVKQSGSNLCREILLNKRISWRINDSSLANVKLLESKLLVLHGHFGYRIEKVEGGVQYEVFDSDNSTMKSHVSFCNIKTNKIEWTANDMGQFLHMRKGIHPKKQVKRDEAMFFDETGIQVLQYGTLWEQTPELSRFPVQKKLAEYNFLIIDGVRNKTTDYMTTLFQEISDGKEYNCTVHMNGKRATILSAVWWATFELKEKERDLEQPSSWTYEGGDSHNIGVNDLSIVNNKIAGKLQDHQETWSLEGELTRVEQASNWDGYMVGDDKIKNHIQIEEMEITSDSKLQDVADSVEGYIEKDGVNVKFVTKQSGQSVFYSGKINASRTEIKGFCGQTANELYKKFAISRPEPKSEFKIMQTWISGKKKQTNSLLREGTFDPKQGVFEGTVFKTSPDGQKQSINFTLSNQGKHGRQANALKIVKQERKILPRFTKTIKQLEGRLLLCDNLKREADTARNPFAVYRLDVHDVNHEKLGNKKKMHVTIRMLADKAIHPDDFAHYCQFATIPSSRKSTQIVLKTVCFFESRMNFISGYLDASQVKSQEFTHRITSMSTRGVDQNENNEASKEQKESKILPQTPLSSVFASDYPLIMYKNYMPGNNELVVLNINIAQPRKVIDLGEWEFVKFISQDAEVEYILDEKDGSCNFYFLVRKEGELRVLGYQEWPWLNADGHIPEEAAYDFDHPSLVILTGVVGLYGTNERNKNETASTYSSEKLQSASFLYRYYSNDEGEQCKQINLVIQTTQNVVAVDMCNPSYFKTLLGPSEMVTKNMIVGNKSQLYLVAQGKGNNHKVLSVRLDEEGWVQVTDAFNLQAHKVILFVKDTQVQNISETEHVFLLDSSYKLRRLQTFAHEQWEEVNSWNMLDHKESIDRLADINWPSVSFARRNFVFSYEGKVHIISLNTPQELKQHYPGPEKGQINDAAMVLDSPFCAKMIVATSNLFIVQPFVGSRRIDYLNYRQQVRLLKEKYFVGERFIGLKISQNYNNYMMIFAARGHFLKICWDWEYIKEQSQMKDGQILSCMQIRSLNRLQILKLHSNDVNKVSYIGENYESLLNEQKEVCSKILKRSKKNEINREMVAAGKPSSQMIDDCDKLLIYTVSTQNKFLDYSQTFYQLQYVYFDDHQKKSSTKIERVMMKERLLEETKQEEEKSRQALLKQVLNQKTLNVMAVTSEQLPYQDPSEEPLDVDQLQAQKLTCILYTIIGEDGKSVDFQWDEKLIVTLNYIVFTINGILHFTRKENVQPQAYDHLPKNLRDYNDKLPEQAPVVFKIVDLKELKKSLNTSKIDLHLVKNADARIVDTSEERLDVIQIVIPGTTIMFDLNEEKEIGIMNEYARYFDYKHFTDSGFLISREDMSGPPITMNDKKNLILKPHFRNDPSAVFTNYSELDLIRLQLVTEELNDGHVDEDFNMGIETTVANFNGQTIFMLFKDEIIAYQLILKEYLNKEYERETLEDGTIVDPIHIRKLYRTLLLPMEEYVIEKNGTFEVKPWKKNIIQWQLDQGNTVQLEILLQLLVLSSDCNLSNVVTSISEFKMLFAIQSPAVTEFLKNSFVTNAGTRELNNMKWDSRMSQQVFGTNSSTLNPPQILQLLQQAYQKEGMKKGEKYAKTRQVLVRILDIEWLSSDFGALYTTLASSSNDSLFRNELIKILISQQSYTAQIVVKVFLPYFFYWLVQIAFYSYLMVEDTYGTFWEDTQTLAARLICLIFLLLFAVGEILQVKDLGVDYMSNMWNYLEFFSTCLHTFIVLQHGFKVFNMNFSFLVSLSSIAVILLYFKMFYWLRLFDSLAFYVHMVAETVYDISNFIILFFLCVLTFAHAIFVLNRNSTSEETDLYGSFFGWQPADAAVSQYLLGLGEFGVDTFEQSPDRTLIWIYFLIATFLTNLTFLNMLIAIMGDTYARVTENKEQESLKERTNIYADYLWTISLDQTFKNKKYLYITTPVDDEAQEEDDGANWEGGISRIKKAITRKMDALGHQVSDQGNTFAQNQAQMLEKLDNLTLQTHSLEQNQEAFQKLLLLQQQAQKKARR